VHAPQNNEKGLAMPSKSANVKNEKQYEMRRRRECRSAAPPRFPTLRNDRREEESRPQGAKPRTVPEVIPRMKRGRAARRVSWREQDDIVLERFTVVGDDAWLTTGGAGSVMVQQGDVGHTWAHSLEWGRAQLPKSRRRLVA
jgi:hypothetical protein